MEDKIGSLEVGKEADLIVIRGKPDINLDDLVNVEQVFINGKRMI
jgi:imidazolonepropionase-like amidohydrolase